MIKFTISTIFFWISFLSTIQAQVTNTVKDSTDQVTEKIADSVIQVTADTTAIKTERRRKASGFFPTGDIRSVDGFYIGPGYKFERLRGDGTPRISQKISAMKNLNSEAFQVKYSGQWYSIFNHTDLSIDGFADVKGNIINYFGRGNKTYFDESLDFRRFYRVKFSLFQIDPSFRFHLSDKLKLSVGPSFQYSTFEYDDNKDRFITYQPAVQEYESLGENKSHGGLVLQLNWDTRDNQLLPSRGLNFSILTQGYTGLNDVSGSFVQAFPQISFYKSLDSKGVVVLAERLGAGFTSGNPEFYQNAFLGSQDNLLGYRKFRFAGDRLFYNNLEARVTLLNAEGKKLRGKLGLIGFYDVGRVWLENDQSSTIHQGYGGGLFLSPLNKVLLRAVAGFSNERMQLTAAVRQRF